MKKRIRTWIKNRTINLYHLMVKFLPVEKKVILFESNLGRNYTGNPRAIYEEMIRHGLDKDYQCIWFFENPGTKIPGAGKVVKRARLQYLYYMAVGQIWVFDCRQPEFLIKRKETAYIQTWHGTPLKKLALDMEQIDSVVSSSVEDYHNAFRKNTASWDYLLSQNHFSTETFKRCFDFEGKPVLEIGYPRNDVLFRKNKPEAIKKIKKRYGIPLDKKVILYAPTWRDNEFYEQGRYKFVSPLDFDLAKKELSGEYVFLVKYHYLVADQIDWSDYEGFVYSFDEKADISELYLTADLLITDYSSVMFDYSILKRPMLFFAYDLENYKDNLRGFYFDFLEEAPGPISKDTRTLIADIKNYRQEEWTAKYEAFSEKYNHADDGRASEKVMNLISNLVEEGAKSSK
ncbi:MAG: CDP-glycerol glycerophosphotransferase family protein [Lachnospiraceae bacterium]|nr:CDP-glycerol glycerophosphotransferase family protein [Lachnospiraceae bacterium]